MINKEGNYKKILLSEIISKNYKLLFYNKLGIKQMLLRVYFI